MKRLSVSELAPESPVQSQFLVQSKERKISSNGSAYLDLELRDATGAIKAKVWDADRLRVDFEPGEVVRVEGRVDTYKGAPQIIIRAISRCRTEEVNLLDFMPHSLEDPEAMFARLLERLRRMPEGPLRKLLLAVAEDDGIAPRLKLAPAATALHHAYLGGLLEHVLSLVELGDRVCDHYPWLDRELVVAGLVLHDIGKIEELEYAGAFRYTNRGQLVGHIVLSLEIVRAKAAAIASFPAGLQDQIEHILLSHHGKLEFGSPKEPAFPEALAVHYLDDLDSKLQSMRAQYAADFGRPGDWTSRNRALGRELFKRPTKGGGKE
ncbi:MAG: phosphohydrolase [Acidobacteria bacterium]|nr:MAG: phosphohydrolase [Acidobacteriota bacterium]